MPEIIRKGFFFYKTPRHSVSPIVYRRSECLNSDEGVEDLNNVHHHHQQNGGAAAAAAAAIARYVNSSRRKVGREESPNLQWERKG